MWLVFHSQENLNEGTLAKHITHTAHVIPIRHTAAICYSYEINTLHDSGQIVCPINAALNDKMNGISNGK